MLHLQAGTSGATGVACVLARMDRPIVFGLPGGHMVDVVDALRDHPEISAVLVRGESLATVMAEAYARLSGSPAVVIAQGAWVLGAGGIGIMEAHLGSSPMLVLVDATEGGSYSHHGPYQSGFGDYGAYDLPAALRAITKRTFVATDPVQAVEMTQLALVHATTGEPGPVAVVFHSRALQDQVDDAGASRISLDRPLSRARPVPDPERVTTAAGVLVSAERPVILVGNGARGARDQLVALSDRLSAPMVTTAAGKGAVPEDQELSFGVIGAFGNDVANRALGSADVVLAVGTKIGATDTIDEHPDLLDGRRQTLVHVDVEPLNLGWTHQVDHALLGPAEAVLPELTRHAADVVSDTAAWRRELRHVAEERAVPELVEGDRVNPRALAALLGEALPNDAVVTCDAGENRLFMLHDYRVRGAGTLLQPNGGGGMGYAIPAALAATYALPDRLAVAVVGDGGLAMTLHGLMTAVEQQRDLLVVVMDNQALGWVLHGQGDRPYMSEFAPFDYTRIAEAMGCRAVTARDPGALEAAVREAARGTGVRVIVVPTALSESFMTLRSPMAGRAHEEVPTAATASGTKEER